MIKTLKTTLSNIYTVLCSVVIVIAIIFLITVATGIKPFVMIFESMHPEVPKGSLVLMDTRSKMIDVTVGDNVAYLLGKVEAMHKVTERTDEELIVKSLTDDGESTVSADMISERKSYRYHKSVVGLERPWIISGLL